MSGPKIPMLEGARYGAWTVLGGCSRKGRTYYYKCACECGGIFDVHGGDLRSGKSRKCRVCQLSEFQEAKVTHGFTRGRSRPPEYRTWMNMKSRCNDPGNPGYPDYGGRGITICDRWRSFDAFMLDMGPKPDPSYSIERIDNSGNYEPGNCVWANQTTQSRNQRSNRLIKYGEASVPLAQAVEMAQADGYDINYMAAYNRLARGWSDADALTRPRFYRPKRA